MKGYSTKYALTKGIEAVEVDDVDRDSKYQYCKADLGLGMQLVEGKTFFASSTDAEANAVEQANRKIASLEKSLTKMRALAKSPKWVDPPGRTP